MRRQSSLAAAFIVSSYLLVACASRPPRQLAVAPRLTTTDTIAARVVELELQRIALEAGTTSQVVSVLKVDAEIETFRERLRGLPDHQAAEHAVAERVLLALDARESSVMDRLRGLRLMYTDSHPAVRQALDEQTILMHRRDELHAVLVGASGD